MPKSVSFPNILAYKLTQLRNYSLRNYNAFDLKSQNDETLGLAGKSAISTERRGNLLSLARHSKIKMFAELKANIF